MRLALETLVCFLLACVCGSLNHLFLITPNAVPPKRHFAISGLNNQPLEKRGAISLTRWKPTRGYGDNKAFPKLLRVMAGGKVKSSMDCAVEVEHNERLAWVNVEGSKFGEMGSLNASVLEPWKLTVRNTETVVELWNQYTVFGVVWNPYVRFVAAYERLAAVVAKEGIEFPFRLFCQRYLSICPKDNPELCAAMINADSAYTRPQSKCTHTDDLLPAVDRIIDVSTLKQGINLPEFLNKEASDETLKKLATLFDAMRKDYAHMAKRAEILYRQVPSCLETVYEFYYSDFLFLEYPKLQFM